MPQTPVNPNPRTPQTKRLVHGSTLGAGVVLALALLAIVNYFGWKYHERFDWTASKLYTLSEKSENVLSQLDVPIEVVVFLNPGSELYEPLRELLARYAAASLDITVRFVDPVRNLLEAQQLAKKYGLTQENVVVVASPTDRRLYYEADLADFDFSGMQLGGPRSIRSFKGEQVITGAILELAENRKPKVLVTTGHGERKLDDAGPQGLSSLRDLLGEENVDLDEWESRGQTAVPEGTDVVVVPGPTANFSDAELDVLGRYLEGGGRMVVLLDPVFSPVGEGLVTTGFEEWLRGWGIEVGDDVVLDPVNNLPLYQADTFYVASYGSHPVTQALERNDLPAILSVARSVAARHDADSGDTADAVGDEEDGETADDDAAEGGEELLFTSSDAWAERDLVDTTARPELDETDLAGPVPLGVVVERRLETADEAGETQAGEEDGGEAAAAAGGEETEPGPEPKKLRLVVYGDSDLATNRMVRVNVGNQVLVFDTLNWLMERESLLGIPAKEPEQVRLAMTPAEVRWVWILSVLVLPGAAILLGVWIYFQRRR
jgi:ABC-type uncharacterized transport system involved in gliding motility auxiliary subunit